MKKRKGDKSGQKVRLIWTPKKGPAGGGKGRH